MKDLPREQIKFLDLGLRCKCERAEVWPCFHQHNEVELIFMERGSLTYRFTGSAMEFREGNVISFWSAVPHRISEVGAGAEMCWITVPLGVFLQWRMPEAFVSRTLQGGIMVSRDPLPSDSLSFRQWERDLNFNNDERARIAALEMEARLRRFALETERSGVAASRRLKPSFSGGVAGRIEKMTLFIAQNHKKNIRAADVAKAAGLHPNYAVSLFRSHCGAGITEFIQRMRIAGALRLLSTTDAKVADVAFESGFSSLSNFYAVFRRVQKDTPSGGRKKIRGH
jgi:AraC-like DNA-binding protein